MAKSRKPTTTVAEPKPATLEFVVSAPTAAEAERLRIACRDLADFLRDNWPVGSDRPRAPTTGHLFKVGTKLHAVHAILGPHRGPFRQQVVSDPPAEWFAEWFAAVTADGAIWAIERQLATDATATIPANIVEDLDRVAGPATAQLESVAAEIVAALYGKGASMLVADIATTLRRDEKTVRERLTWLADNGYVVRLDGRKGFALTERGKTCAARFPVDSR
jgi:hypothetical protein